MELIAEIERAWSWTGISPTQVVGDNEFGNLIVKDCENRYWRLCPEDLYCIVIANNRAELDLLSQDQEFLHDWHMAALVAEAKSQFGPLRPGYKYCLKIPGIIGGEYGGSNLATIPLIELVAVSGHVANEIRGLPDGAQVNLKIVG